MLAGSLPLRYCSAKFASRTPFWSLLVPGHVAGLITDGVQAAQIGEAAVVRRGVDFVGISVSGRKRFRLNRKTPAHLVGSSMHTRPRVWKRLHEPDTSLGPTLDFPNYRHRMWLPMVMKPNKNSNTLNLTTKIKTDMCSCLKS